MKVIPLQRITTFHRMTSKYPDSFLFKFNVICRGYDYTTDPHKLKVFPSNLKRVVLNWFMGLGGGTMDSWDAMKSSFLTKYQDYSRSRDLKYEIFKMSAKDVETLEEYVDIF